MEPTDELYNKYAKVINSFIYKYACQYPDLEDDLYLQAGLLFCNACRTYDENHPSHASFNTWLLQSLHRITDMIDKWNNGPCMLKGRGCVPSGLLEPADGNKGDDKVPVSGIYPTGDYLAGYTKSMTDCNVNEYPDKMQGTLSHLEGEALQIFRDWCAGVLDKSKNSSGMKSRRDERKTLNPMRIYRRRYMALGWTFERTRKAWGQFSQSFQGYAQENYPSMLLGVA